MAERVYPSVIRTALALFRALDFRFTIEGEEHIPTTGGAVLASNHVSYLDFMFVGLAAHPKRRYVRFMAKQAVFDNPVAGPLMRGMHHIPVDRSAGAAAYDAALEALRDGELVGVFPESTISRAFVPRTLKTGAARLALASDTPLIPVVVWGGHRLWTTGRRPRLLRHVPVVIRIGEPVEVTGGESAAGLTGVLHDRLTKLADEVQRGYPAPPGGSESWWQPAHLGGTAPTLEAAVPIEAAATAAKQQRRERRRSRGRSQRA